MATSQEFIQKAVEDLRKSLSEVGEFFKKEEKEESASASPASASPASAAPESSAAASPAPESSAPTSSGPEGSASPAGAPPAGAPAAGAPEAPPSVEELKAAFMQIPPDQLPIFMQALQAVMQARAGATAAGTPAPAPGPMASPSPSPAPAPATPPMPSPSEASAPVAPAFKSEQVQEDLKKAKEEIETLKKAYSELMESTKTVVQGFEKIVSRPMRKAFTGQELNKSETASAGIDLNKLSKSEVMAKLNREVLPNPDLSKSDRELVDRFACGEVKVDEIAKFFKK